MWPFLLFKQKMQSICQCSDTSYYEPACKENSSKYENFYFEMKRRKNEKFTITKKKCRFPTGL